MQSTLVCEKDSSTFLIGMSEILLPPVNLSPQFHYKNKSSRWILEFTSSLNNLQTTYNRKRQGATSPCGDIHRKNTARHGVSVYKNKSSGFLVQASKQSRLVSAPKERGECFLSDRGSLVGRIARPWSRNPVNRIIPLDLSCSTRRSRRKPLRTADAARQQQVPVPLHEIFLEGRSFSLRPERKAY